MKPYREIGVRNRTPIEGYGILDSYLVQIQGSDCMIEKALEVDIGHAAYLAYHREDRKRLQALFEKEVREGKYTQAFFDALDKTYKDNVQDIKSFWKSDFSKVATADLVPFFDRYYRIYITTLHPMVLAIYASDLGEVLEKELRELLARENPTQEDIINYTALLLTPTRLTQVQMEEQQLCEIEAEFLWAYPGQTKEDFGVFIKTDRAKVALEKLAATCGWFHMEYLGEAHTPEMYENQIWRRITDAKALGEIPVSPKERLSDALKKQKDFLEKYTPTKFFRDLVFAMQEWTIVLDYTKADLVEGLYYSRSLITEVGKRLGNYSWIDVRFLFPDEIRKYLKESAVVEKAYFQDRFQRVTIELKDGKLQCWAGEEAEEVAERLMETDEVSGQKEFKGMTAYPGKVRGKAVLIMSAQERHKSRPGQILVTRETTTELTSVIKMSSAIVADHGGLLSHTAIVAREFKIPCIVKSMIATKLIKDGDELEVDATNGIVKILN